MIDALLKIRLKQLYRGFIGVGWIRIIFLIGLLAFLGGFLFTQTANPQNSFYVIGVVLLIIYYIQTKRKDKLFLSTNFPNCILIFYVEYLFLVSPIIALLIFHFQWVSLFILLSGLYLITHLSWTAKMRSPNTWIQRCIPFECFEWKAGIRQSLLFIIPLWIIGLCTTFFLWTIPIVLFILGIIPLGFYEIGEPYQMVLSFEMRTNRFLFHKIKMQTILFSIIVMPLVVSFLIFHYEMWYIPIAEYLIFISLHVYWILTKYAFYEPNCKSSASQVYGIIGILGGIIPVFLPVVWLLSIHFFFKSQKNLNYYLNDYN